MRKPAQQIKRVLDIFGVLAISPLVLVFSMVIAILIRLTNGPPAIFRQIRAGRDSKPFTFYKFRTMRTDVDPFGPSPRSGRDPRLTRIGRWLRLTSLDELPQLFNVLTGHMSLVGPRPPLPCEVQRYQPWHKRRLEVSPGITGLWQVSGRSELTFDEQVLLDLYYIENWSPALDVQILLRTFPKVLLGNGAY